MQERALAQSWTTSELMDAVYDPHPEFLSFGFTLIIFGSDVILIF